MYNNEPFDDYIRSILGYPNTNNIYSRENNDYDSYSNYSANYPNNVYTNTNNQILEKCYPEIYKIIYPMVRSRCTRITEPVTEELLDNITNEIYSSIEVTNEVNIDNINIASQNEVNNSNNTTNRNNKLERTTETNKDRRENNKESREDRRDSGLRDLIKILLIRELIRNQRPNMRPPRLPFPGGPNRPPIMPRYNYMDLYEN